jgi:hypothetical protein
MEHVDFFLRSQVSGREQQKYENVPEMANDE